MSESSTGEEGFPWLVIAGALVAVVVVVLAAVGYNKSREQD
jgi:LPXTG-motif cell wall-anchored protein